MKFELFYMELFYIKIVRLVYLRLIKKMQYKLILSVFCVLIFLSTFQTTCAFGNLLLNTWKKFISNFSSTIYSKNA